MSRAVVTVDSGPEVQPFAEVVQQLEPMLRGPGFAQAWTQFEMTLGLDRIPEPKPKSKSAKKQTDAAQPSKLSLLPPDPPPDVPIPMHRTTSPASNLHISEPPPPPPIPKSSSGGPVLPSEEPELK